MLSVIAVGMPGAIGIARPSLPLVGRTSTSSKMPWYAPVNITILSRPDTVRETRIAAMTASEPVLQNAARSMPTMSQRSLRHFTGKRCLRADLDAGVVLRVDRFADEAAGCGRRRSCRSRW